MKNIFYFKVISKIGGTEQFLYEIAKKYKDWDITIYYDSADKGQLRRLQRYVRCLKRDRSTVKCDKAFFNFNIDMIDEVEAKEYIFVSHANWDEIGYKPPIKHPKLTGFIGVSEFAKRKLDEYGEKIGIKTNSISCYNPLTIEPKEKTLILVSACRLEDNVKGGKRTLELIQALDNYCLEHNRHYLWLIFTNTTSLMLNSKNVVFMKPRVDVRPYIQMADYVLQLSNDMETYCYTIAEALSYGVPIVTTPLSVIKELPIDNNMRIELNWDCTNKNEVAKQIFEKEVKPFKYIPPEDSWNKILEKSKSTYKEELSMKVKVRVLQTYHDLVLGKDIEKNVEYITNRERADYLVDLNLVEIIENIKEEKQETKKVPTKKVEKK